MNRTSWLWAPMLNPLAREVAAVTTDST